MNLVAFCIFVANLAIYRMQKKFLLNLLLLLFLNLLVKPFWIFGVDRTVQNRLGSEEYGMYFAIFNFTLLFNFLLDLGLTNYNNRKVAYEQSLNAQYAQDVLWIKVILSVLYVLIVWMGGVLVGYRGNQLLLLVGVSANQVLSSFITFFRSFISGMQRFALDSIFSVLDKLLVILIMGFILWTTWFPFQVNVYYFVGAQTVSLLIVFLMAFTLVYKDVRVSFKSIHLDRIKVYIKEGYPFALLVLLMTFYTRIDAVLLERLLPDGHRSAGIYAMAFRILDAFNMVGSLFGVILLPLIARMLASKQDVKPVLKSGTFLLLSFAAFSWMMTFLWSSEIVGILYTHDQERASKLLPMLMGDFFFIALIYIYGSALTAAGQLKTLNIITSVVLIINVTLNVLLIPQYEEMGAGWASLITQGVSALLHVYFSQHYFQTNSFFKWIGYITLFFVGLFFLGKSLIYFHVSFLLNASILTALTFVFVAIFFFHHLRGWQLMFSYFRGEK
jgi:O-antigen/teichoic acid export membrane protein